MGSATNELQFKVMLGLDSAVSQAELLKKILSDSVKPNTNDYKSISSSIDLITKSAEKLRDKMKDAFKTSSGTKSFFKEYEKLSDLLETVLGKFGNVKFDNMLFSKEDLGSIKSITKEMDTLESSISAIKKGKISDLFDSGTGVAFDKIRESITELGGDVSKISFDALVKNLTASSDGATDRLNNLLNKIKEIDTLTENLDGSKSNKLVEALKESDKGATETKLIDPAEIALAKLRLLEYYELLNNKGVETEKLSTVRKGTSSADFIEKETERIEEAYEAQRLRALSAKDKIDDILFNASKKKYLEGRGSTLSNKEKEDIINNSEVLNALSLIGKSLSDYDNLPIKEKFQLIKTDLADGLNNLLDLSLIDLNKQEITDKLYSIFDGLGEPTVAKGKVLEFKNNIQTTLGSFNLNLKELGLDKMDITAGTKVADVYSTIVNSLEAYIGKQKEAKLEIEDSGKIVEATNAANAYKQALEEVNNVKSDRNNSIENKTESLEELRGKILDIVNAWGQMTGVNINNILNPSALKEGSSAMTNYINSLSKLENHLKALSNVKTAVTRWMGFYLVLNLTKRAIKSMSNHITELDSVMTKIAVVTKMSLDDLWGQIGLYSEIARQYGVAIKGVYEVSLLYYQQGLEKGDVMNLTLETLKMARIAGIDYALAADYMTTAIRGFKLEMSDAGHVTDVFSNLAAHTASSTEELAVAISKTASSAESVNSSFEATSAMMATMISTTRESATNIGSALKSIISRYGELKENKTGIDAEGEEYNLNKVDKALLSVGISIHDANGQFRDFDDVILELGESWDSIDKNAQRYIATIMAGNRLQSRFLSLVGNVEEYKRALSLAENADESGDILVSKTMESIETKVERMKVTILEFYTSSGILDLYKGVLDTITNVISSANNLPKALGNLPVTALAVGALIIGAIKNLALFAIASLLNGIERIKTSGKNALEGMIPDAGNAGLKAGEAFKINFLNQMDAMKGSNKSFLSKVFSTDAGKLIGMGASTLLSAGGAALSLSAMNKYGASKDLKEDLAASGTMWGAAGLLGLSGFISGTIMSSNPIVGALSGLASALPSLISAISMNNKSLERLLELSTKNLNEAKLKESIAKGNERDLESARDKLQELEEASYKSTEAMDEYKEYMNSLADTYPELVSSISETGDAIIELSSLENALTAARLESIDATSEALNKLIENNKLLKENYEHLANFGTSGYTPDNLFKILVGGNRTLAAGYESTLKSNALTVVLAYNDWAKQGNGTVFKLDYSLDGKTLKDPGLAWNILFDKANEGSFAAFYDALMQQIEDIASTMSSDKALEYLHSFNLDYNLRKERYILALKEFKEAADKTDKGAPSYSTLTGQKIDDLEEIRDWDEDTLLEAIENTKEIANDYIDSYNLSIDNLDNLLSNTLLNKELLLKINASKKESNKDYNLYKSFIASMVTRRYGEGINWSTSENKDLLNANYDYWTNWINNNEKQAEYLMNEFNPNNFRTEEEVKKALAEKGGLDVTGLTEELRDVVASYVQLTVEAITESRHRAQRAVEEAFTYEGNKNQAAEIYDTKKALTLYDGKDDESKFIAPILDSMVDDFDTIKSLRESGYTLAALNYYKGIMSLYGEIGELSNVDQTSILPLVKELDLQDTESLDSAIETLTSMDGMGGLVSVLKTARNNIITNVVTLALSYAEKAKDITKELDTTFGNVGKALSYASIVEQVLKLITGTKDKTLKFDDLVTYDSQLGSWVLSQRGIEELITLSLADFNDKVGTLRLNAEREKEFINNLDLTDLSDKALANVSLTEAEMEQLGIDPTDTDKIDAWAAKKQLLLSEAAKSGDIDLWRKNLTEALLSITDNEVALLESILKNSALNAIASIDFNSIVEGKNRTTEKLKFATYLKAYNEELSSKTESLWELLLLANYEEFEAQTGIILSSETKREGQKSRATSILTALSELADDTLAEYSDSTEALAGESHIGNLKKATPERIALLKDKLRSELDTMLAEEEISISDYNESMNAAAKQAERRAGRGRTKAIADMMKDGITSDEMVSYILDWGTSTTKLGEFINENGELTNDALKEIYEEDLINGGFKLKLGLDTDFVILKLGEAYGVTITKGSKEYNKLAAELFNQLVSDIDSEIADRATLNTGKLIANLLKTLSSAEVGQEVNISTLTDDMKAALGVDAAETTMTIASELLRDNLMLLLESSIENYEEEGKEALLTVYNSIARGIRSKRNVAAGTLGILSKYVSLDAAELFVESIGGSVDTAADVMTARGYIFNEYTQLWLATDKVLENKAKDLARAGDDPEARKQVELFYNLLEYSLKENPAQLALNNLLSGYTNLTDDTLATFESEFGISPADMVKYYTTDAAGVRKLDVQKLKADFADKFEEVLGPNWEQIFDNTLSLLSDQYIEEATKAGSLASQGTTSASEMQAFTDSYNEKVAGANKTAEELFNYNDILDAWILDPEALHPYVTAQANELKKLNILNDETAQEWIKKRTNEMMAANVDIDSFLKAEDKSESGEAYKKLSELMRLYYQGIGMADTEIDGYIQDRIKNLTVGGTEAVKEVLQWARSRGKEATSEEIEEAYSSAINDLDTAMNKLSDLSIGQITTGKLKDYLTAAGKVDADGVVTDISNMLDVYTQIYNDMKTTAGHTTAGLNSAYAKVLTEAERGDIDAIEAMGDAMGMTYDALGQILGREGTSLESWLATNKDIYENIGAGKIRITDFTRFAALRGWEPGSEEYTSAFKSYNDSLIEYNNLTLRAMSDEIKGLLDAQPGDWLNLTYTELAFKKYSKKLILKTLDKMSDASSTALELTTKGLEQLNFFTLVSSALEALGATLENGILKLSEEALMDNIASLLEGAVNTAGEDIPDAVRAEISDVVESIRKSYSDAITKGIEGGMTSVEAALLTRRANEYGVNLLTPGSFVLTGEGLQLSLAAAIDLYTSLSGANGLLGKLVYGSLTQSLKANNKLYKTTHSLLAHIGQLLLKITDLTDDTTEAHKKLKKQLENERDLAKSMALDNFGNADSSWGFNTGDNMAGSMSNIIDYYSTWGSYAGQISNWATSKKIDPSSFIDLAAHVSEISLSILKDITFLGLTFTKDGKIGGMSLNELLSLLFTALEVDNNGNAYYDASSLSRLGFNITEGTTAILGMYGYIDEYLQPNFIAADAWNEFVNSLDSVLSAMEKSGRTIDSFFDSQGILNLQDFNDFISKNNLGETWNKFADNFSIGNRKLSEIFKDKSWGDNAKKYSKAVKGILQMIMDTENWDNENRLLSISEMMTRYGIEGDYTIDGVTIHAEGGTTITQDEGSTTWVDNKGHTYTGTAEDVVKSINKKAAQDVLAAAEKYKSSAYNATDTGYTLTLGDGYTIEVVYNLDGSVSIKGPDGRSLDSNIEKVLNDAYSELGGNIEKSDWFLSLGLELTSDETALSIFNAFTGKSGQIIGELMATSIAQGLTTLASKTSEDGTPLKLPVEIELQDNLESIQSKLPEGVKLKVELDIDDSKKQKNLPKSSKAELTSITPELNISMVLPQSLAQNIPKTEPQSLNEIFDIPAGELGKALEFTTKQLILLEVIPDKATAELPETLTLEIKLEVIKDETTESEEEKVVTVHTEEEGSAEALANIDAVHDGSAVVNVSSSGVSEVQGEIDSIHGKSVTISVSTTGKIGGALSMFNGLNNAYGNVGLAHAKSTLMGELGPEMVVLGNRYFVVGLNGPEFVNLADDAIVFNHLQTLSLLEKGTSATRGQAITSERKAVAYAHGNVNGGPARKGKRETIPTVPTGSRTGFSLKVLNSGGTDGTGETTAIEGYIKNLEKWYNLLQEIAKLEEKITYQEQLRAKISSDLTKNGKAYYESLKKSLEDISKLIQNEQTIVLEKEIERDTRMKELSGTLFDDMYDLDEDGLLKENESFRAEFDKMFKGNDNGAPPATVQELYEWLKSRYGEAAVEWDSNGKLIEFTGEAEKDEASYKTAVEAALKRMEDLQSEIQDLTDDINDKSLDILSKEEERNEILAEMRDNQLDIEDLVLNAVVEIRERAIEEMENERDLYQDLADKMIEGLTLTLNNERAMYDMQSDLEETDKMRRRLAILQSSGGSASEIIDLQELIRLRDKDMYFEQALRQIDAIQLASDKEIERLDEQISLDKEVLEYLKAHGLLWNDVYTLMVKSPAEIATFIQLNTEEYWSKSPVSSAKAMDELLFKTEQWGKYRDDTSTTFSEMLKSLQLNNGILQWQEASASLKTTFGEYFDKYNANGELEQIYLKKYEETSDPVEATNAVRDEINRKKAEEEAAAAKAAAEAAAAAPATGGGSGGGGSGNNTHWMLSAWNSAQTSANDAIKTAGSIISSAVLSTASSLDKIPKSNKIVMTTSNRAMGNAFAKGTLLGELGPEAWVANGRFHVAGQYGAEMVNLPNDAIVFNHLQTARLLQTGKAGRGSAINGEDAALGNKERISYVNRFWDQVARLTASIENINYPTYANSSSLEHISNELLNNNTGEAINIEHAEVNMNVERLANDYDAKRAGEQALQEMLRIARKSSVTTLRR